MSRPPRLTWRAEASLVEIAKWTIEQFGLKQADLYESELLARCQAILNGQAHSRSCALLVDNAANLRFARAGEHFLVFLDQPDEVIIIDSCIPAAIFPVTSQRWRLPEMLTYSPAALVRFTRNRSRRRW